MVSSVRSAVDRFKSSKREEASVREKRRRAKGLESLRGTDKLHSRARGPHPQYPTRGLVLDSKVLWRVDWPEYEPVRLYRQQSSSLRRLLLQWRACCSSARCRK